MIRKLSKKIDRTMLMFESHLIPLPTPESADSVEAPMMNRSATSIPRKFTVPAMLSPAGFTAPSGCTRPPMPIRVRPATNWSTPKPKVWATPRIVATTATISMMCPSVPESRFAEQRCQSGPDRQGKAAAIGKVGQGHADDRIAGPCTHTPVQEGPNISLPNIVFAAPGCLTLDNAWIILEVRYRLRDSPRQHAYANACAEHH